MIEVHANFRSEMGSRRVLVEVQIRSRSDSPAASQRKESPHCGMTRLTLLRTLAVAAVSTVVVGTAPPIVKAQDQAPPCPAYVIEGTIGTQPPEGSPSVRTASVYVHATGTPLPSRQVIATFADASGATIGEPAVLVTDAGGRADVDVPESAESVNFVAETPDGPGCTGEDGADPRVLLEIVPVSSLTPDGPVTPGRDDELASTGPLSEVIALASLLLLAFGAAVGTGRGRRRVLARAGESAVSVQGVNRGNGR